MTINNLPLSELVSKIHRLSAQLNYFEREAKESSLFIALSDIEIAARSAQEILNQIRFQK